MMHHTLKGGTVLVIALCLAAWTAFHLELHGSYPEADSVLHDAPTEVWLQFSVVPDMEKTSFSITGPHGDVELGDIGTTEDPKVVRAEVTGEMPAGNYRLSWVGAPMDDHAVRGRFSFSIQEIR